MRDVAVHDCPKRMACQSGDKCGNFTITHRKGELDNLESMINSLIVNYHKTLSIVQHDKSYTHMLSEIKNKISNLNVIKERALSIRNDLTPIRIFDYIDESIKLPRTLSELFAIEQNIFITDWGYDGCFLGRKCRDRLPGCIYGMYGFTYR